MAGLGFSCFWVWLVLNLAGLAGFWLVSAGFGVCAVGLAFIPHMWLTPHPTRAPRVWIARVWWPLFVLEEMKDSLDVFELLLSGEDEVMVKKSPKNGKHDTGKNRKTHSSSKGEVTVVQRRLIWERNQLDLALYKFVREQLNLTKNK